MEYWLKDLESSVKEALKKQFFESNRDNNSFKKLDKTKMLEMIQRTKGQILLTSAQIEWTKFVNGALTEKEKSSGTGPDQLRKLKGTYKKKIDLYIQCVENQNLKFNQR